LLLGEHTHNGCEQFAAAIQTRVDLRLNPARYNHSATEPTYRLGTEKINLTQSKEMYYDRK